MEGLLIDFFASNLAKIQDRRQLHPCTPTSSILPAMSFFMLQTLGHKFIVIFR